MTIAEKLIKAHDEKRLVSCKIPYGGDLVIALERHMVDHAIDEWRRTREGVRHFSMLSVLKTIKHTVKRMKRGRATGKEMDELAADVALWIGHELLFSDGEKHLVKGPTREDLLKPAKGFSNV